MGDRSSLLIDDFEDGDNQLAQPSNRSGAWYASNDGSGVQVPVPSSQRSMPFLLGSPGSSASPVHALRTVGWGFTGWGAFVSVDLNAPEQAACAYDVSAYSGVRFNARGTGALRFMIGTVATAATDAGGQCQADTCTDYGVDIELGAEWTEFRAPFAALALPGWAEPAVWAPSEALRLTYWVSRGDFDFWIDDVAFY